MICIKNNVSTIVKLVINHLVCGIYSLMLLLIFYSFADGRLLYVGSIISAVFYLCLIYSFMWTAGAKDANSFYSSNIKKTDGLLLITLATLPSIVTNVLATVLHFFKSDVEFAEKTADLIYPVLYYINYLFMQCMYSGLFVTLNGSAANIHPVWFLLSIIPALLVGTIAYTFGFKSFRLRTLFGIKYDVEKEKIKQNY